MVAPHSAALRLCDGRGRYPRGDGRRAAVSRPTRAVVPVAGRDCAMRGRRGRMAPVRQLPSGTVTFVFSDIEGSTRRWQENEPAMRAALERHDAIVRSAMARHTGHVVKHTGDGILAVFAGAADAVAASVDAQRAL